jgi:hypothetical protein
VKSWKTCERRIAEELGGVRIPVSGRGRGDNADVDHPSLSIEVKSRKKLPAWLLDAIAQAEAAASPNQLPVAVLHQDRSRYSDALVVMRLSRFESLISVGCR